MRRSLARRENARPTLALDLWCRVKVPFNALTRRDALTPEELLLVPNHSRYEVLAIGILTFGADGHGLTILRDHRPAYGLVRPAGPFALVREGVGIYLPYRNPVIK